MRRDGMGHGVARLYAKRREALDRTPGQDGWGFGQDGNSRNRLKNKAGQDGQHGQGTKTRTHACASARAHVHGSTICPVCPVHPVRTNNGAGLRWTGHDDDVLSVLSNVADDRVWSDLDAWCRHIGGAGDLHARRIVLREWVEAAGGWSDAAAVYLPTTLRPCLALGTLKAHARALRLAVREDQDDPSLMAWLQGMPA